MHPRFVDTVLQQHLYGDTCKICSKMCKLMAIDSVYHKIDINIIQQDPKISVPLIH